jgi:hypothetical protein
VRAPLDVTPSDEARLAGPIDDLAAVGGTVDPGVLVEA